MSMIHKYSHWLKLAMVVCLLIGAISFYLTGTGWRLRSPRVVAPNGGEEQGRSPTAVAPKPDGERQRSTAGQNRASNVDTLREVMEKLPPDQAAKRAQELKLEVERLKAQLSAEPIEPAVREIWEATSQYNRGQQKDANLAIIRCNPARTCNLVRSTFPWRRSAYPWGGTGR